MTAPTCPHLTTYWQVCGSSDVLRCRLCDEVLTLRDVLLARPAADDRIGDVVVTCDERAALHHLSSYTHYLSDAMQDAFYSLYSRLVVREGA